MRVLFDLTVTGCHLYRGEAVGITSYVKDFAPRLVASPRLEVDFGVILSLHYLYDLLMRTPMKGGVFGRSFQYDRRAYLLHCMLVQGCEIWPGLAERFGDFKLPISDDVIMDKDIVHLPLHLYDIPDEIKRFNHLKVFYTIHDLIPVMRPEFFSSREVEAYAKIFKNYSRDNWYFCVSESTKNDLCDFSGISEERTFVVPLAVDTNKFFPCYDEERIAAVRKKYKIPPGPYLLTMGRLQKRKNFGVAVQCFERLKQQEKIGELSLILGGAQVGWNDYETISMCNTMHNSKHIIITGYIEEQDLAPLYSGALALLFPSAYEGFGLPALEGMQCGTPVITSNNSSLPEVVGDGGLMVDPNDVDGFCDAVLKIYNDSQRRQELVDRGLSRAQMFSWDKHIEQVIAGYEKASTS